MNKLTLGCLLIAAGLTIPTITLAMHDGSGEHCMRKGASHLTEADTNKDGSIDKSEAQAMHDKHFDAMDANKDGKLNADESKACDRMGRHDMGSRGFMGADKDNDGTLDRDEAKQLPNVSKNFDAIDVDKSGTVSRDEVHNFMHDRRQ